MATSQAHILQLRHSYAVSCITIKFSNSYGFGKYANGSEVHDDSNLVKKILCAFFFLFLLYHLSRPIALLGTRSPNIVHIKELSLSVLHRIFSLDP